MPIVLKSPRELEVMRRAGAIVATVLCEIEETLRPGQTTGEVDAIAERTVGKLGAKASFKGLYGFPGSVCISVNEEIVHGIPSRRRVLNDGDIISIDVGVKYEGYHTDSATTVAVGRHVPDESHRLLGVTQRALAAGIEAA